MKKAISGFASDIRKVRGEEVSSLERDLESKLNSLREKLQSDEGTSVVPEACLLKSVFTKLDEMSKQHRNHLLEKVAESTSSLKRRQRFAENLVVVCCGKVGSGKSTLGNLIGDALGAKYFIRKDDEDTPIERFGIDDLPVSGVRYFVSDDLVWIDSPGRFSQTADDDKDALNAIKEADALLFLTDFRQALDTTEREALTRLVDNLPSREMYAWNQCSTLVLSHADRKEVVDIKSCRTECLPFSEDDKANLLSHVKGELSGNDLMKAFSSIVIFSSKLAEFAKNERGLIDSGLIDLLESLKKSISVGRADLKRNNLIRNLGTLRGEISTLGKEYSENVDTIRKEFRSAVVNAEKDLLGLRSTLQGSLEDLGDRVMRNLERKHSENPSITENDVDVINKEFTDIFEKELKATLNTLLQEYSNKHFEKVRMKTQDVADEFSIPVIIERKDISISGEGSSSDDLIQHFARLKPDARNKVEAFSKQISGRVHAWMKGQLERVEEDFDKLLSQWKQKIETAAKELGDLYEQHTSPSS